MLENVIRMTSAVVLTSLVCVCVCFILSKPSVGSRTVKIIHEDVHVDVKRDLNCFVQNEIGQRKTGSFESQLRAFFTGVESPDFFSNNK